MRNPRNSIVMAEQDFSKLLVIFDNYVTKLEIPQIVDTIDDVNANRLMEFCQFVETTATRALSEDKAECLESNLRAHWSKQRNRTKFYTIAELKVACDGLLEVFLKDPSISCLVIDKLLRSYAMYCGVERLNAFIGNLLENSITTSVIFKSLVQLGVTESDMENEIILEAWENEASRGKQEQVSLCIAEMLKNGEIGKIIDYASRLRNDSVVKKLIMQRLTLIASEYEPSFYAFLADIETKILRELLSADRDFRIYFFDGIFYFGRNMNYRDDSWHCEHEFDYELLVGTMRSLSRASEELNRIISERLEDAKIGPDRSVWIDVERDLTR